MQPPRREIVLRTSRRRCVAAVAFCLFTWAPTHAQTVSLLNGSELSMAGLNLTVSNCVMIIAGWRQSSCAAGNLVLQAVSGSRGTSSYQLAWNSDGTNGTSNIYSVGGPGLYQVSFALAVATTQSGSSIDAATLIALSGGNGYCGWPCSGDLTASQAFSAAAGGKHLTADLLSAATVSSSLTKASAFSISETVTMNTTYIDQLMGGYNPDTPDLGLVRETFAKATEPASIALLLGGLGGLAALRSRRRCSTASLGGTGQKSRPGSLRWPIFNTRNRPA
jgi:hypothetical protein